MRMQPITETELEAIAARCKAARPSPWKAYIEGRNHECGSSFIMVGHGINRGDDIDLSGTTAADIDFIANARQDIPRLVAEVKRLKKLVGEK